MRKTVATVLGSVVALVSVFVFSMAGGGSASADPTSRFTPVDPPITVTLSPRQVPTDSPTPCKHPTKPC